MSINIHEAKTHFSRIVERAAAGETVIIARAGRPIAKVSAVDSPSAPKRLGFLVGLGRVPDDFNEWGRDEIAGLFDGAR